jgi:hypothetical protein
MGLIKYDLGRNIIPLEVGGDYHWEVWQAEWVANRLYLLRGREEALYER